MVILAERLESGKRRLFWRLSWLILRLCRLPCGKPPAFRVPLRMKRGFASGGLAAKRIAGLTEARGFQHRRRRSRKAITDFQGTLKIEAQPYFHPTGRLSRRRTSKVRRHQYTIKDAQIRVVQKIERLRVELKMVFLIAAHSD